MKSNSIVGARIIETLTSALYSDPIILFREYVQNSVDSYLQNHENIEKNNFRIDIIIDINKKNIRITDNGNGIKSDDFINKMGSISNSDKNGNKSLIGFKGIGRLSGLPFCDTLIFRNKPVGANETQLFIWENNLYKKLLEEDINQDIAKCISEISKTKNEQNEAGRPEHFFEVELQDCSEELLSFVQGGKKDTISTVFLDNLSNLLPVPYSKSFNYKEMIHKKYKSFFNLDLSDYEFDIFINNEQIFKSYKNEDIMNNDIHFIEYSFKDPNLTENKIGVLWFSFNYVFKIYKGDFGIRVRSKNMLVNDRQVFADECDKSIESPSSYGQLVNGLKGIKGEFLIFNTKLADNSKRDWFVYDRYGLALRVLIVQFMTNLNKYRRKASQFFNDENQTEEKKEKLMVAFQNFVAPDQTEFSSTKLEDIIGKEGKKYKIPKDGKSDIIFDENEQLNILRMFGQEYVDFLNRILTTLYEYFSSKKQKEYFFETKYKILETLKNINE